MQTQVANAVTVSEARKAALPAIMQVVQQLRTTKNLTDQKLHPMLDKAWSEANYYGEEAQIMFLRVLFHIGDISRQHNILTNLGIMSSKGGAGERSNFRSILRWMEAKHPEFFYKNLNIVTEFTVLSNLFYDELRTDRKKGTILSNERMKFDSKKIVQYLADLIRTNSNPLIAKHLPKWSGGLYRKTGEKKRAKQQETLMREKRNRDFIKELLRELGWTLKMYKDYRSKQHTPEQLFSSHEIDRLSDDVVMKMFDGMTSSQRFRVAHMVAYKDASGRLAAKPKWQRIGNLYVQWENRQTKVADAIRKEVDPTKREKLVKELKVKATGMQTIDLLVKIAQGNDTEDQINNTYQAMLEKMDLVGNIFPIIDGSASMNTNIVGFPVTRFQAAAALAIAFATRNPNIEYRNQFGWFSNNFVIVGNSKYVNTAPNPFVKGQEFVRTDDGTPVISSEYTFTKNFQRVRQANPGIVANTNIGATIEYFVNLHKRIGMSVEELPSALLFITDNEGNSGLSPTEFMRLANSIGWYPLVVFWGIVANPMTQYKDIPNCLFIGGFNEGVLSQILRGIKSGTIMPETELWSINDDIRYSIIK